MTSQPTSGHQDSPVAPADINFTLARMPSGSRAFASIPGSSDVYAFAFADGAKVGYLQLAAGELTAHILTPEDAEAPEVYRTSAPSGMTDSRERQRILTLAQDAIAAALNRERAAVVRIPERDWPMRHWPAGEITVAAVIDALKGCNNLGDDDDIQVTVTNGHTGAPMRFAGVRQGNGDIDIVADPDPAGDGAKSGVTEVWIMETGEAHEGGRILGIYADRDLARDDFIAWAVQMCDNFGERAPDLSERKENGALKVEVRCDWLTLEPCPVVTAPRLPRTDAPWEFRPADEGNALELTRDAFE